MTVPAPRHLARKSPTTNGRTVLVGCDGSADSYAAVSAAARESTTRSLPLTIAVVVQEETHDPVRLGEWQQVSDTAYAEGRAIADRATALALTPGTEVLVCPAEDPRLAEVARRADVLVVGRYGARGTGAFAQGSTSADLLRLVDCPVLVPGPESGPPPRGREPAVVAGVDRTDAAYDVAAVAATAAHLRGWPLALLQAIDHTTDDAPHAAADVWRRLATALETARAPGSPAPRATVEVGDPVPALASHVRPGDLLVVGTRGGGRLAGLVPGSVARGLLDLMPCDLLVVPAGTTTVVGSGRGPAVSRTR